MPQAQPTLLGKHANQPKIDIAGPRTLNGVQCLPDFFPKQDFDPARPKSIDSYQIPQFDESVYTGPAKNVDYDVKELLKSMTIEEKVGQLSVSHVYNFIGCDGNINTTAVEYAFDVLKLGFIFGSPSDAFWRYAFNSPQRFANFSNTIQKIALSKGSKIPVMYGIDSIRGANFVKGSTFFPTPLSAAATFNPVHAYNTGRVGAKDSRAAGTNWVFGPGCDLNVNKMWSRNFESYGEDPFLSGEMAYHYVKGLQGNYKKDRSRVASCFKHFIAYSTSYNGKDQEPRQVPMNMLMEYHVPSFKRAIEAGAATGMESYGSLNGQDVVTSKTLLQDLLRTHLNYTGPLSTDSNENLSQYTKHKTAISPTDASYQMFNNTSIDIQLTYDASAFISSALDLFKSGTVQISRLDESVGRILQLKKDIGLFETPYSDPSLIDSVGSKQDVELARNAARESLILLKNTDNVLPLSKDNKILYIGANFNSTRYLIGGWNVHANGPNDFEGDTVYDGYGDTILSGVQKVTGIPVKYIPGYTINGNAGQGYKNIIKEARKADKIVFFFGQSANIQSLGNIDTLKMAEDQYNIVKRVSEETSTPIIIVLAQNQPFSLGELSSIADGIINANLPGSYGGLPIAEALFGEFSPSGRQPYTYPKFDYQSTTTYFTPVWNEYSPEFAFGQGMGYNEITYSNITTSSDFISPGNPINISVTAVNNGKLPQMEPVLMYTTQQVRRGYSPEKYRLRAFDKQLIAPGASRTFTFELSAEDLMFWNVDLNRIFEEGMIDITINAFNKNYVKKTVNLKK
ncbi:Lysosomal beta glucosidase [Smittium culicis]|uniref:beta-glucosidase n=1 Tax=Smittium culicis TaxID=133412 RepID=A0A1R1XSH7_9FUNG|nr:Lysosomal beta glucosidase [Smittium culicis]